MKAKVYSYHRISGKGQIDGDGIPRQRDCIQAYCLQNNFEIDKEFNELGISGTKNVFDRPALSELFEALKVSEIKIVLVETAQRLARDLMISEILLAEFRKMGVKVIACDCGSDLSVNDDNPTQVLIRQLLSAISQFDKSILVSKLKAARVRIKKATGKCEGQPAYGTTEQERATIALILDYRRQGMNPTAISRALNETGVKPRGATRAGKTTSWYPPMVSRILARA